MKTSVGGGNAPEVLELEKLARTKKDLYGIFGQIDLAGTQHLLLIEEASYMGNVVKAQTFRVDKILFVPLTPTADMTIPRESRTFVKMIEKVVSDKAFYFSY